MSTRHPRSETVSATISFHEMTIRTVDDNSRSISEPAIARRSPSRSQASE